MENFGRALNMKQVSWLQTNCLAYTTHCKHYSVHMAAWDVAQRKHWVGPATNLHIWSTHVALSGCTYTTATNDESYPFMYQQGLREINRYSIFKRRGKGLMAFDSQNLSLIVNKVIRHLFNSLSSKATTTTIVLRHTYSFTSSSTAHNLHGK